MNVVGIVSEFNPFHNGHRYLIDSVRRELAPGCILAVMSGSFVQRGEPAMWDKWSRAACAVHNGVDLVFELPVCQGIRAGESFARGAIRLLAAFKPLTHLAFGSESGSLALLTAAVDQLSREDEGFSQRMREGRQAGYSYPAAYQRAVAGRPGGAPEELLSLLQSPNDLLALEYLRNLKEQPRDIQALAVKRLSAGSAAEESAGKAASATAIRARLKETGDWASVEDYLPGETLEILQPLPLWGAEDADRYFALVRQAILTGRELGDLLSAREGLENRLKKAVLQADSLEELLGEAKSKRYTYAAVSRLSVQALLGLTRTGCRGISRGEHPYGRLLAFNRRGARLLRQAAKEEGHLPIFTNYRNFHKATEPVRRSLEWDLLASDLYGIIRSDSLGKASDRQRRPRFFDT